MKRKNRLLKEYNMKKNKLKNILKKVKHIFKLYDICIVRAN